MRTGLKVEDVYGELWWWPSGQHARLLGTPSIRVQIPFWKFFEKNEKEARDGAFKETVAL